MIRFKCPRCQVTLSAPDECAGDQVVCGKCKFQLQAPGSPRNQTVLAPLVPPPAIQADTAEPLRTPDAEPPVVPAPRSSAPGKPPNAPKPSAGTFLTRHRGWAVALAVLAFCLLGIVVIALVVSTRRGGSIEDLMFTSSLTSLSCVCFTVPLVLIPFAFWIWMLVDCLGREPSEGNEKLVWVLVLIFLNWLGALLYYFVRRPIRIRDLGR
jgi:hypothetical protein